MKKKCSKLSVIIIVIGLVLAIAVSLITCVVRTPVITEHDFNYSATYKINGETKTLNGVYSCRFEDADTIDRYYDGVYLSDYSADKSSEHVVATKDNLQLCIVFIFSPGYLMGDGDFGDEYSDAVSEPYIAVYDKNEGYEYHDPEMLAKFDAELVSWELPEAIENSFKFSHVSHLTYAVVFPALIVSALCLVAILIFVKKEEKSENRSIDNVSTVLNFVIAFTLLPYVTVAAVLIDINGGGTELYRQILYFFPSLIVFGTAISVALRRKGHSVKSLVAELIVPAVFAVYLIVCGACGLL